MKPPPILLASTNRGKLLELNLLLAGSGIELASPLPLGTLPSVEETGTSYRENAILKAETIAHWSGQWCLADDSGLEVDALDGAPGVYSARFGGPAQDSAANLARLLEELKGVPEQLRTARFRCVLALATPDRGTLVAEGSCEGRITLEPRGEGGFGYDPVFLLPSHGLTFAELPTDVKNAISHRAEACRRLAEVLQGVPASTDRLRSASD